MLILQPKSSTSRVSASCKGPATVVEKCSPHSYVVELDGVRYRLHANHLRQFFVKVDEVKIDSYGFGNLISVTKNPIGSNDAMLVSDLDCPVSTITVNTCAIIRDEDCDFGNIQTTVFR